VPVAPDGLDRIDSDTLEVLGDTQTLADDQPPNRTAMDEDAILTGGDTSTRRRTTPARRPSAARCRRPIRT
jgi:hypothetical protein